MLFVLFFLLNGVLLLKPSKVKTSLALHYQRLEAYRINER